MPNEKPSPLSKKFSQTENYEALAKKQGAMEADKATARTALNSKTIEVKKGETLSEKLLQEYGNNHEGKKNMFSMLAQLSRAGFNVDYVKAGEKFVFSGNEVTIKH